MTDGRHPSKLGLGDRDAFEDLIRRWNDPLCRYLRRVAGIDHDAQELAQEVWLGAPVTPSIAREIAQREQLKALVVGSIASLGHNYVLALEALNARTGDLMARAQVEVTGREHVLTALGDPDRRLSAMAVGDRRKGGYSVERLDAAASARTLRQTVG